VDLLHHAEIRPSELCAAVPDIQLVRFHIYLRELCRVGTSTFPTRQTELFLTSNALQHTHLPTVDKDDTTVDWVRYAAIHTMNVSAGPLKWVRFF
jgi:hypothetical protein